MRTKIMWILGILLIAGLGIGIYFSDVSLQKGRVPKFSALRRLPPSALTPLPDLKMDLSSLTFQSRKSQSQIIKAGDIVDVSAAMKNVGTAQVTASPVRIELKVNGALTAVIDSTSQLEPDQSVTHSFTWTAGAAGSYSMAFCADAMNVVQELNENNNCINGTVNVIEAGPSQDLRVSWMVPFSNVQWDGKVGLQQVTISSSGLSDSSVAAHVIVYPTNDSGTIYPALVKGQDITVSGTQPTTITNIKWTFDELKSINATRFAARVDDFNAIAESNEDNNFLEISIPKWPDWIVQQVGVSNIEPAEGESVDITAIVKNQSENGTSSSPIAVRLYINNMPVEPVNTYSSPYQPYEMFPGGAVVTASFTWAAAVEGSYTTKICVSLPGLLDIEDDSPGNKQFNHESNTDNNCAPGPTINVMAAGPA